MKTPLIFLLLFLGRLTTAYAQTYSGPYTLVNTQGESFSLYQINNYYWIKVQPESVTDIYTYFPQNKVYEEALDEFIIKDDSINIINTLGGNIIGMQPLYSFCNNLPEQDAEFKTCLRKVNNTLIVVPFAGEETPSMQTTTLDLFLQNNNIVTEYQAEPYRIIVLPFGLNALDVYRELLEQKLVELVWLEEYLQLKLAYLPNDEYFDKQWYLKNTGQVVNYGNAGMIGADINIEGAWDITLGDPNIKVSVLDAGVGNNHPDMPPFADQIILGNYCIGYWEEYNYEWGIDPNLPKQIDPTDPSPNLPLHDAHGYAVAGIIFAKHNDEGIAGIAPNCKLINARIPETENMPAWNAMIMTENVLTKTLTGSLLMGASIINCSWTAPGLLPAGYPEGFLDWYSQYAARAGRNGKGTVMVWSAGNDYSGVKRMAYPGSTDGPGVLCVAASDRFNQRPNYSNYGPWIDIAAPSGDDPQLGVVGLNANIWTTDMPGEYGYNPWHNYKEQEDDHQIGHENPDYGTNRHYYTGLMTGTSASAPQVAGVAALMLSVNPCMTAGEVETVLKRNADKVGPYNYYWNKNKPGHSQELGYGKLNAHNAIMDISYEQDETYTSNYALKSGSIKAGKKVTTQKAEGTVLIQSGRVDFRAIHFIELSEGFEVAGGEFSAQLVPATTNCTEWDSYPMKSINQTESEQITSGKVAQFNRQEAFCLWQQGKQEQKIGAQTPPMQVYPNPASDYLQVNNQANESGTITFYDTNGKKLTQWPLNHGNNRLDLSNITAGFYYIQVTTINTVKQWKIQLVK